MARPKGQPPLTVERIVDAALALIDESGLDAFTMRRLGDRLGVDPMAVYHHLPNKGAVIEAVVRHVFDDLPTPSTRGTWQQRVHRWANTYRTVAAAHPNLVLRIVADPAAVAIATVRVNEALYAPLEASGLPAAHVAAAGDVIVDYVNGYVLAEAAGPHDPDSAAATFRAELDAQPPEAVGAQRRALAAGRPPGHDGFTYGLATILTGLEARIE
jgi:TetR/AcrR family tetracycline transcriptional repressor